MKKFKYSHSSNKVKRLTTSQQSVMSKTNSSLVRIYHLCVNSKIRSNVTQIKSMFSRYYAYKYYSCFQTTKMKLSCQTTFIRCMKHYGMSTLPKIHLSALLVEVIRKTPRLPRALLLRIPDHHL